MGNLATDRQIIQGIKKGDEKSLDRCISKYAPYVSGIVRNIIGSTLPEEDREEVISDVFVSLWKSRERLDETEGGNLKGYIAAISRNLAKNKLRDTGKTLAVTELDDEFPDDFSVETELDKKEVIRKITDCLRTFKEEDRICFIKYYYYHLKIKEIAKEMNLTESAVKSKLARSRERIRRYLEDN